VEYKIKRAAAAAQTFSAIKGFTFAWFPFGDVFAQKGRLFDVAVYKFSTLQPAGASPAG